MSKQKRDEVHKKRKVKTKAKSSYGWPIKIFLLAVCLSLLFSVLSELVLGTTGIILSCFILAVLIFLSVISDMIGVAATAATIEPFRAMAAKKVKGAKEAIFILKNTDKVSSLMNDVVGDVCSIISGACGAAIVVKIVTEAGSALEIIMASLISALIAGLTILCKAFGKKYSIKNANKIILLVGKSLSIFSKK